MRNIKNQRGFGVVEVLLIVVLLGVLGLIGWQVYKANTPSSEKAQGTASTTPASSEQSKPSEDEELIAFKNEELGIHFSYPATFKVDQEYPNGVSLKSKDFASEMNLRGISKGGVVVVTVNDDIIKGEGTKEDLEKQALLTANETPHSQEFIKVAGMNAIKFTYSAGENKNRHEVILFFKGGYRYEIAYQFALKGDNPYPRLTDTIADSFRLK